MGRTNVSADWTAEISETWGHVEQRRYARHEALAESRGARDDVRIRLREAHDQRGVVLRAAAVVVRGIDVQDLGNTRELRGRVGRRPFAPEPATRTCTSPPICCAAVTALAVPPRRCDLSCSAMTRAAIRSPSLRS
jgi:hypothetical protein